MNEKLEKALDIIMKDRGWFWCSMCNEWSKKEHTYYNHKNDEY